MTFENPEVIELGLAENLIQDTICICNTEGTNPTRIKSTAAIYVADSE